MTESARKSPPASSLWTTPALNATAPLSEASIDTTVSAASLRKAVDTAREQARAFSREVTEELLRKSV